MPSVKTAKYFRILHTKVGGDWHQGDIVKREEIESAKDDNGDPKPINVNRLARLGAIEPLYDDQGADLYKQQANTRRQSGHYIESDEDEEDDIDEEATAPVADPSQPKQVDQGQLGVTPSGKDTPEFEEAASGGDTSQAPDLAAKEANPTPNTNANTNTPPTGGDEYDSMSIDELKSIAVAMGVKDADKLSQKDLAAAVRTKAK